jgi:hypothetical protein
MRGCHSRQNAAVYRQKLESILRYRENLIHEQGIFLGLVVLWIILLITYPQGSRENP